MIFNWFDLIIVAFLAWGFISGKKSDFITELIKLLGAYKATFIAVHYFHSFGVLCGNFFLIPKSYAHGFALLILSGMIYALFFFMAKGWRDLLKLKYPLFLDKWGSIGVALLRSYILCGLVYLVCVMLLQGSFARGAKASYSFPFLSVTSGKIYEKTFVAIVDPIFKSEEFNRYLFKYVPKNKFDIRNLSKR